MSTIENSKETRLWTRILSALVTLVLGLASTPFIADYVEKRARAALKPDIAPSEVKLTDMRVRKLPENNMWHLEGAIQNLSPKFTLSSVKFKVAARDFPDSVVDVAGQEATPESEAPTFAYNEFTSNLILIPPGETMPLVMDVGFKEVPHPSPRGHLGWTYEILSVEGFPAAQ